MLAKKRSRSEYVRTSKRGTWFSAPIAAMVTLWRKECPRESCLLNYGAKTTGSSGGRGGSMHMYAPEYGFMGTNGIVGAPIPLATGAALSAKMRKNHQVVVCFFGDGAVNSGSFHEAVNMGAVWNLPVVYVCENNLYATEMAFLRATKNTSVASRAAAYGMPGVEVDGQDVVAVHEIASELPSAVLARMAVLP